MKRIILISFFSLFLLGCSQEKNLQYFMTHPEKIKPMLAKCNAMSSDLATKNQACLDATMAQQKLLTTLKTVTNAAQAQAFGKRIIITQSQLAKDKENLQKTKKQLAQLEKQRAGYEKIKALRAEIKSLNKKIDSQQQAIQRDYALVRLLGE